MIKRSATLHLTGTNVRETFVVVYSSTTKGTAAEFQEPSQ